MLNRLVKEYLQHDAGRRVSEHTWWTGPGLSFADVVRRCAISKLPNDHGRLVMHGHQRRPGVQKLNEVANALAPHVAQIEASASFENLIGLMEKILSPIAGVGELIIYDVAERIGHRLGLAPQVVYLHSGAREGAKILDSSFAKRTTLAMSELPPALGRLTPAQIEDFLCIFKARLQGQGRYSSCAVKRIRRRAC